MPRYHVMYVDRQGQTHATVVPVTKGSSSARERSSAMQYVAALKGVRVTSAVRISS